MLLAAFVVEGRTALHRGHQRRRIERLDDLQSCHFFGQVEEITPVAVGHGTKAGARILVERKFLAVMGFGALQQGFERRIVETAQHQHLGARQQRAVEFEGRISVVAPTSTTVPSSTTGRKLSCWLRLKRWISSTKSSVPCPVLRRMRAASNVFFRSATPENTADNCSK